MINKFIFFSKTLIILAILNISLYAKQKNNYIEEVNLMKINQTKSLDLKI